MSDDLSGFSLLDLFRIEAESQTAVLSSGLLAIESDAGASGPEALEPMMRAAHSLKGAARIVGVDAAVRVAHAMEDVFVAAQKGTIAIGPAQVDVLLRAVDLLTQIAQVAEDQLPGWQKEHEQALSAIVDGVTALLSAPPPPPVEQPPEDPVGSAVRTIPGDPIAPELQEIPRDVTTPDLSAQRSSREESEKPAAEGVVRVTAASLSRLLGLAGESLIQSRQLRPFVDSLRVLKGRQSLMIETLNALEEHAGAGRETSQAVARDLLARVREQAVACEQGLLGKVEEIEDFARRGEDLSGRLHHEVLTSRMRPLSDALRGFPRMVRDVARQLGKSVEFVVVGEATGVDRDILEKLEAPLNHLVRNALDHAIEPPEERTAAGKRPAGTIRLEARHRAGMLQITLADDGRGIDPRRLRAKVVARGLASPAMAEQLSEAELLEFLFLPGFSTRDAVTEMSGRGVGLDVVQTMVRAVGGVVRIATQVGRGTRFVLQLPITRSVIRALLVEIAGEPYAFPLNRIDRIVRLAEDDLRVLEGRRHFTMDDQPVGLVEAARVLDLPPVPRAVDDLPVVVVSDRSHRFGVIVGAFLGERDLEVRPLDPRLGKVPDISSASVLEDGVPVLIVDVEDLVRSIDNLLGGRRLRASADAGAAAATAAPRGPKRVLVVDDSITVRELERQLLEARGYAVDVAVDGVDGWNAVRGGHYQLVISDVDMPRMDGIELVRSIKSDPRLRSIPVVIVSYKEREEDRMRGLDAGADAYLTKSSFHDQTLLDTVADLIGEPPG
jgi:two-component system sensor histidine kinase and response regulator WspE